MGGVGAVGRGPRGEEGRRVQGCGGHGHWGVGAGGKLGDGRHLGALCIRGIRGGGFG